MNPYNSSNVRKSRPSSSSSYVSAARPRSVYSSPSRSGSSAYSSFGLSAPSSSSSSYLGSSPSSSYLGSSPSSHHHYSSSSSGGVPSYSTTTYGGTASGYGGLTIAPSSSSPSFSSYMSRASAAAASPSSRQSHASRHSHVSPSAATPSSSRNSHASPSSRHSHAASPSSRRGGPLKRSYYQSPLSRFDSSNSLASSKSYGSEGYASGGDTKTSSPSSRLCSISSSQDSKPGSGANSPGPCSENGDLDYKALYEEVVVDNERLRRQLQKTEEDLLEARITIEKQSTNAGKNTTLSETEKRERRAMERKLSEMEEELKQMEQLRQENQRLKDENGALIRVISKLSK